MGIAIPRKTVFYTDNGPRVYIQEVVGRLTTRSREGSKRQDMGLDSGRFSDRSPGWIRRSGVQIPPVPTFTNMD